MRLAAGAVAAIAACGNQRDTSAPAAEPVAKPVDASRERFVRVDREQATGLYYQVAATGDPIGHMELVGEFLCRLDKRFGRGDLEVPLAAGQPELGFPLRHVATGQVIVPMVDDLMGYAGEASDRFEVIAHELDALLAATAPGDCEYTFPEAFRVDHAGVRGGTPFFEHLGVADTLAFRLGQFAYNDEHGGARKDTIEQALCAAGEQNWADRHTGIGKGTKGPIAANAPGFDAFAHKEELKARLVRCMERDLAEIEDDIASDRFDADAAPADLGELEHTYQDIVGTGPLSPRIRKAKAALARGHRRP